MATYYLHVRNGLDELLDGEGAPFGTITDLIEAVLASARQLISADVLTGKVDLAQRIDAEDANGHRVHSLQFRDAVTLLGLNTPSGH